MKDRRRHLDLAEDVRILIERSSAHPVEYAIMLLVLRDGQWRTVRTFDNAHGEQEHHEHRYTGGRAHDPVVTHGAVNEAMVAAIEKLRKGWPDIVRSWENR